MDTMEEKLKKDGDIRLGVNAQVFNAQLGINTSGFLLDNLYLGARSGFMRFGVEDFSFGSFSLGLMANYQWLPSRNIALGMLQWRGINFGTGVIYQRTTVDYDIILDTIEQPIPLFSVGSTDILDMRAMLEPEFNLEFSINTITIPLEVMTSVRLFYILNLALGAGIDIGFGSAKLGVDASANASVDPGALLGGHVTQTEPARLSASIGGSQGPRFLNPKVMTGVGFSLGPVILDIPFTVYLDTGYSLGFTLGVAW
jgi:hypothetical protein